MLEERPRSHGRGLPIAVAVITLVASIAASWSITQPAAAATTATLTVDAATVTGTVNTTLSTQIVWPTIPGTPNAQTRLNTLAPQMVRIHAGTDGGSCSTQFQTDFANCFAPGAGVSCAKKCVSKEQTCIGAAPTTRQTCRTACRKTRRADVKACGRIAEGDTIWAGGDAGCLTTAQANLELCRFACSEAELSCRIALRFCVANCANL